MAMTNDGSGVRGQGSAMDIGRSKPDVERSRHGEEMSSVLRSTDVLQGHGAVLNLESRTPDPLQGHPRVLVRPEDLPRLRRKAETTHAAEMRSLRALAEAGAAPGGGEDYADSIRRLAFLYLLSSDRSHAEAAIAGIEKLLPLEVSGAYFIGARRLKALAWAYDWMHDALPEDLRRAVGERALEYCQALYDTGEVEPGCYFLGHAINQMPAILMAGIAIGDEIQGARWFVEDTVRRMELQLPCYRHFLERDSFQQSYSYTTTYMGELPWLFQAMEAGLGIEMYQRNAWFANVVKWWTYAFRDDGSFIRFGDYFCAVPVLKNAAYYRPFAAIASRYRDSLAQWWVDRFAVEGAEPDQFLFNDRPGVEPRSPEQLGLSRTHLFDRMGVAIARGDFDRGTVAAFKCTPIYLHNHGHRDANSFTIYHKGDLAIDSGAYDAYETPHWYNYYVRTIAHNTIVVHDPDEQFNSRGKVFANDGGQRFINQPHFQVKDYESIFNPAFRDGQIIDYREGDGWSYVCGDASNCYRSEKLTRFLRHVVFVLDWPRNGSVSLVVLDEIELAREELKPRFLLHTMEEPRVEGSRIEARHGGGRLTATVLLPEAPRVELIGGPGREFEVDGRNYPLKREMPPPYTSGAWRAEISARQSNGTTHRFLTLLTAADADAPADSPASLDGTAEGLMVRQGGLAVGLFQKPPTAALAGERAIAVVLGSESV
jgi:hypothetical protein